MIIGKNIKKIRTVKGLSQSAFAEIFGIKRSNISAYEEGRANPKMGLTVKIAKYFSVPVEDFLSKELTINEFLKFNSLVDKFEDGQNESNIVQPTRIPYINKHAFRKFNNGELNFEQLSQYKQFQFPFRLKGIQLAIEIDQHQITVSGDYIKNKDIIFCERKRMEWILSLDNPCLLVKSPDNKWFISEYEIIHNREAIVIKSVPSGYTLETNKIKDIFEIKGKLSFQINGESKMEERIKKLEKNINRLNKYLGTDKNKEGRAGEAPPHHSSNDFTENKTS